MRYPPGNKNASAVPDESPATVTDGLASMTFTANGHVGSYSIVFYTFGSEDMVGAHYMTNLLPPGGVFIFLPLSAR